MVTNARVRGSATIPTCPRRLSVRGGLLVVWLPLLLSFALACTGDSGPPADPTNPTTPTPSTPAPAPPPATFTLSGIVQSTAGGPVVNAEVWLDPTSKPPAGSARTDSAGAYRITGLLPRRYDTLVQRDQYEPQHGSVTLAGDMVQHFSLRPGVTLSGRTFEEGVGDLGGVTLTVTSGPSAGLSTVSTAWGAYTLGYITPGTFAVRVSKPGYVSVDKTFAGTVDERADYTLRWSYGGCLTSVTPVIFEHLPSAGSAGTIVVGAHPGAAWTATASEPWIEVITGRTGLGNAPITFRVGAHADGAIDMRRGAVQVRCGETDGQNVWLEQYPDCQTRLAWTDGQSEVFPSKESVGSVLVTTGVPGCHWEAVSETSWIRTVGIRSWYGNNTARFVVETNQTGAPRTGRLVIGEQALRVVQQ